MSYKSYNLTGNFATFKLPTGETVRQVQLEYFIKETGKWKLKNDPPTFFPKNWSNSKIEKVIKAASEKSLAKKHKKI